MSPKKTKKPPVSLDLTQLKAGDVIDLEYGRGRQKTSAKIIIIKSRMKNRNIEVDVTIDAWGKTQQGFIQGACDYHPEAHREWEEKTRTYLKGKGEKPASFSLIQTYTNCVKDTIVLKKDFLILVSFPNFLVLKNIRKITLNGQVIK